MNGMSPIRGKKSKMKILTVILPVPGSSQPAEEKKSEMRSLLKSLPVSGSFESAVKAKKIAELTKQIQLIEATKQ